MPKSISMLLAFGMLIAFTGCSSLHGGLEKKCVKENIAAKQSALQSYIEFIGEHQEVFLKVNENNRVFYHAKNYASYPAKSMSLYMVTTLLPVYLELQYDLTHYKCESKAIKQLNSYMISYANNMIKAFRIYNKCLNQKMKDQKTGKEEQYFKSVQLAQVEECFTKAQRNINKWNEMLTRLYTE